MATTLTPAVIKARAQTFDLVTVFSLSLAQCPLDARSLIALEPCVNLAMLDISHCALTSLASLPSMPKLHTLIAANNTIDITSLSLLSLPVLVSLDLSVNNYDSESLALTLASLSPLTSQLPSLQSLTLALPHYPQPIVSSLTSLLPSLAFLDGTTIETHSQFLSVTDTIDNYRKKQSQPSVSLTLVDADSDNDRLIQSLQSETSRQSAMGAVNDVVIEDLHTTLGQLEELGDACDDAVNGASRKYRIEAQ